MKTKQANTKSSKASNKASDKGSKKEKKAYSGNDFPDAPELGEFNGHKTLNFEPNKDRFGMSMGLRKIRAVLEHLDECKAFSESNGESID